MLHLAQVQKKGFLGKTELRLLACERTENAWAVLSDEELVTTGDLGYGEGLLVLLDLGPNQQVQDVRDASPWILEVLQRYLSPGVNASSLEEEFKIVEGWRQSLTLQSQEFSRRQMELEARREQLQALEDSLSRREHDLEANLLKLHAEQEHANRNR